METDDERVDVAVVALMEQPATLVVMEETVVYDTVDPRVLVAGRTR